MAIIYSYPDNYDLLSSDMLVGTSTKMYMGKPKQETKNFTLDALSFFANHSGYNTLNTVLTNGNTSLLDANVGNLGIWDATASSYAKIKVLSSEFKFYSANYPLNPMVAFDFDSIVFNNMNFTSTISTGSPSANRTYTLPNASGIIALTTDIPDPITLTTVGTSGAATLIGDVLNIPNYSAAAVTPTLQEVTDQGNVTTESIFINELNLYEGANNIYRNLKASEEGFLFNNPTTPFEFNITSLTNPGITTYFMPNASGTLALTSDIPSLAGYVQTTRTLTINGTTYDLSANRTWNVGDLLSSGSYANPSWITSLAYSKLTGAPTIPTVGTWGTLNYPTWTSGTPFVKMTAAGTFALDTNTYLTSAVTSVSASGLLTSTGGNTPTISTQIHTNVLVGRTTAGTGTMEEITVGSGLTLSAGTLSATASGSYVPYTGATGNVDLGIYTLLSGHFLTGPTASANFTRFPNALAVISNVPSGVQHNESLYMGLMSEGLSVGSTWASGVYGAGYTNSAGSGRGTGVTGEGHVSAATDTGVAVGVRGYATDTHTGNYNIGLYGDAENGDTGLTYGGNVSLFLANGNIVTSSAAAKSWYLGGNLTFDGQGTSKTVSFTNGATLAFPSLTSGSVLFSNGTTIAQDNANFFWNDSTNRLGIGTNSPSAALHVNGNMYLQNAATAIESIYFSSGPLINNDGPAGIFRSGEVYTDTINGYVGIGNGTPSTALDVIGVITATGGNSTSWNAKQDAITLTTTGTSGPATLVGSTLNIPQYSGGGGGSTPVKLTSQTLAVGSWTLSGGYYTYSFSNVNITTTCDVSVTPQNASYLTAYNAQVLPFVGVASGVATFYSQFPPQDDMVVDIVITQTT